MHTCEFLDPCAPAGHGQLPPLCRDPGRRVHPLHWIRALHLAGNCVHPDRSDPQRETRCVTRSIKCSSKSDQRIHATSVECMRKWLRTYIYIYRLRVLWIFYGSEIILVLHFNAHIRAIYSKQFGLCCNLNFAVAVRRFVLLSERIAQYFRIYLVERCALGIIYTIPSLQTQYMRCKIEY